MNMFDVCLPHGNVVEVTPNTDVTTDEMVEVLRPMLRDMHHGCAATRDIPFTFGHADFGRAVWGINWDVEDGRIAAPTTKDELVAAVVNECRGLLETLAGNEQMLAMFRQSVAARN